ncbi:MAG: trifunctional transcriptional activator/DNA repair protein Ada/methylated-DNA--[protein]-cysteine S-methyltransferase [Gammaproteobacteria bacterium]
MMSLIQKRRYYQALLAKDPQYDGLFYVGVKTTGVFCHVTCPARKPKFENCEFFENAKQALLASFRSCQRCRPLSHPKQVSAVIQALVAAVEQDPEKRWTQQDFKALAIDESTARRQFKKRFGMTFVEYARARRMGLAMKHIKAGKMVIDSQLAAGYQSASGFYDAFTRIMGAAPTKLTHCVLKAAWLDTQLGPMVAIADDTGLYLLEFIDRRGLEREIERLRQKLHAAIIPGETTITQQIHTEITSYFAGKQVHFKTSLHLIGSTFQQQVWHALMQIPAGETRTYTQLAQTINQPSAVRAVGRANGANQLSIIVPCHRIIGVNGDLTGYGGGIQRKQWLLEHEQQMQH